MTRPAVPCPYRVGRVPCVTPTGPDGRHPGAPHDWPPLCPSRHLDYQCTRPKGHPGTHESRTPLSGTLAHAWAPRSRTR